MAYFEGNAVNLNTFNTFTAANNIFFDNIGILYTSGTVTLKNGMTVTMSNNKFDNNMVGQKGSAIQTENIVSFSLLSNQFTNNGPTLSYFEAMYSPYYKYILDGKRFVGFYDPDKECLDEFDFYENCKASSGNTIQLPVLQGAVNLYTLTSKKDTVGPNKIKADANYFYNNQAMPILDATSQTSD